MSAGQNALSKIFAKAKSHTPTALQPAALSLLFNSQVKFAGLAGIRIEDASHEKAHLTLKNKLRVQNHIGTIHACGMALLAESASGVVFGLNVPDTHIPVIKNMAISFKKPAKGDMNATATLTQEQIKLIQTEEKGSTVVQTVVKDETGQEPISVTMEWAWTPKKKRQS